MMDIKVIKTFVLGLIVVCLMTLLGIYYVWQNFRLVNLGGNLAETSFELRQLQSEHEMLEGHFHALRSNEKVTQRANGELGMKQPTTMDIILVEKNANVPHRGKEQGK